MDKRQQILTLLKQNKPMLANAVAYHATAYHPPPPHTGPMRIEVVRERAGKPTDDPEYPRSKEPPQTVWDLSVNNWRFGYYTKHQTDEYGLFVKIGPHPSDTAWYNRLDLEKVKDQLKRALPALNHANRIVEQNGGSLMIEFIKQAKGWD